MRLAPSGTYGRLVAVFAMLSIIFLSLATNANAFWTARGTATGTGSAGAPTAVSVDGAVSGRLAPGRSADLALTITNPNAYPVRLLGISATPTVLKPGSGACSTSSLAVALPADSVGLSIAAGSTRTVVLTAAVSMAAGADPGCQGARFSFPLTAAVSR